jgi:transposase
MLTKMTEEDWARTLKVFDAAKSKRGEPGHDDRNFLEAIFYFVVHNITWRALPERFGNWNTIWKRFWRLSRSGVFEVFFQLLAESSETAHLVQMLDSTVIRAHVSAAGAKGGQENQALGKSRGGFSTKIHVKVDFEGMPIASHTTAGQASDCKQLEISVDIGPDIKPRAILTDKGYDSEANRAACRKRKIVPVIPRKSNSKKKTQFFPKLLYKTRGRVEQFIGKLKRFKRIAFRCEKTKESYQALIDFVCGLIWIKSVHTA